MFLSGCKINAADIPVSGPVRVVATVATPPAKPAGVPRDRSITRENAYNDLFLDSADVVDFVVKARLDDSLPLAMHDYYNRRNYEYTWFSGTGLIEQSISFRSLYSSENDADLFNKSLENRLDRIRLVRDSAVSEKDPSTIRTELQLTLRFIQYARKNYAGMGISAAGLATYIPAKRKLIIDLGDSVLVNNSVNINYAALNESYRLLKIPLRKYIGIEKNGGWGAIALPAKKWIVGDSNAAISLLKKRLRITGELTGYDSSDLFNAELEKAVQTYQLTHGYEASGIVTKGLVKDMNISALTGISRRAS